MIKVKNISKINVEEIAKCLCNREIMLVETLSNKKVDKDALHCLIDEVQEYRALIDNLIGLKILGRFIGIKDLDDATIAFLVDEFTCSAVSQCLGVCRQTVSTKYNNALNNIKKHGITDTDTIKSTLLLCLSNGSNMIKLDEKIDKFVAKYKHVDQEEQPTDETKTDTESNETAPAEPEQTEQNQPEPEIKAEQTEPEPEPTEPAETEQAEIKPDVTQLPELPVDDSLNDFFVDDCDSPKVQKEIEEFNNKEVNDIDFYADEEELDEELNNIDDGDLEFVEYYESYRSI